MQLISTLRAYDPEQVILFGSHARGNADEYSDLIETLSDN